MSVDSCVRILPFITLAMMLVGAVGCATRSQPSSTLRVLRNTSATLSLTCDALVDMTIGEQPFTLLADDGDTEIILVRREPTTLHGATVAIHEGDHRVEYLARLDDDSIALTAVADLAENALTLFTPPLVIAPASLEARQPFTSEAAMRVIALDNPTRQRERGTAKRTLTYVDDVLLRIGTRDVAAARVEIRFIADLRFADADERTTLYVSRDAVRGVLLQETLEKITILAAFPRTTQRTLVRME